MDNRILVVLSICLFLSISYGAPTNCFVFGEEGTTPFPPSGYTSVTLDLLKGSLGASFFDQYNSNGIPFLSGLDVSNCLASLGAQQCVYLNGNAGTPLVPYTFSGIQQCIWDLPPGPVKLGWWNSYQYYPTLNQSALSTWVPMTCPGTYTHYTLLHSNNCSTGPTPPPPGSYTCCFYFSHVLDYQSSFCQKGNMGCPSVSGFVLVYNQTATSCSQCELTSLPSSIFQKYSSHKPSSADKPELE